MSRSHEPDGPNPAHLHPDRLPRADDPGRVAVVTGAALSGPVPEPTELCAALAAVLARHGGGPRVELTVGPAGWRWATDTGGDPELGALLADARRASAEPAAGGHPGDAGVRCLPEPAPPQLDPPGPVAGLELRLAEEGGRAVPRIRCREGAYEPARLHRLLVHLDRALAALRHAPGTRLGTLDLLDPAERERLDAFGRGPAAGTDTRPLHVRFAEHAARAPDALAAVCAGEKLSYRRLDEESAALATELHERGVGPGDVVAVVLDRGLHTLVAMLGVLRSGAAYTPVDPAYPAERIDFILRDTDARAVLCRTGLAAGLPGSAAERLVLVDAERPARTADAPADPQALAYVLYTSGSTGPPKGVPIDHAMLGTYLDWMTEECRIGPGSRVLHACSPVFDLAVGEVFSALVSGATVVVATREEVLTPGALGALIGQEAVTHSFTPPTLLSLVDPADCPELRCVLVAGEVVAPRLVERWREAGARVLNLYGPAEATVSVTWFDCTRPYPAGVPIGQVMPGRTIRLLDRWGGPAPLGAPGEIVIGGQGVAAGYLRRPELTAERFDSGTAGGPWYRTGDLGRWLESGDLEFLGRADDQVKLNGRRIEPGEIEAVLAAHPDVSAAAVTLREDSGPARLVAYVTGRPGRRPDPAALRAHAARTLPAALVPAATVVLDRFPLGATGKIDRRALPAPGRGRPVLPVAYRAPADKTQRRIAEEFEALLGIDGVGADDDLFHLGGTSLDAARLCAAIGDRLGRPLPVSQIHRTPTPAALADWLDALAARPEEPDAARSGVRPGGGVALTPGQADLVAASGLIVCSLSWWIDGTPDRDALVAALGDVHARHQPLHASYHPGPPPAARLPRTVEAPEVHLLPDAPDAEAALAAADEVAQRALDLPAGRVWRAVLVREEAGGRELLSLGLHHAVFDGASEGVLTADLSTAYAARSAGRAPRWPVPAPTLAEVAEEHARAVLPPDLDRQRAWWGARLRNLPKLVLPGVDRAPLPEWGPKDGRLFPLPADRLAVWREAARRLGATLFAVHAAICGEVWRRLSGQRDVGMMVPVARRGGSQLERAVVNRAGVLCLRLDGRPYPGGALAEAAAQVEEALRAQDVPFSAVLGELATLRPDVHMFFGLPLVVYQDNPRPPLDLPGCRTEPVLDRLAKDVPAALTVELLPLEREAVLRVTIRTDRVPVALAEAVGSTYLDVLAGEPAPDAG
ncbi:amino acid adenylation domain-containing protein [Kitasatospora sp. NPDC101235]|uniref:non-ribosomal peptide synthetase n=1 Tax=Kitasatospora sp. NPDC101235 TaxID=3364101 RepID=UPI00381A0DA2